MSNIPLNVAYEKRGVARDAGARWNADERVWQCASDLLTGDRYQKLRAFVPRIFRPELKPPFIRPWMVPQPLWGKNLRALLDREQWDIVRRKAYGDAGYRCRMCGGKGDTWPVEADEAWHYDDYLNQQTLKGVIALCPACHSVRHWGKSMISGKEDAAYHHMMMLNGSTRSAAEVLVQAAFAEWEKRSKKTWSSEYSWITKTHGFAIEALGIKRAETANSELVSEARTRATDTP